MAANGISTMPNKATRKTAKLQLAAAKRQRANTAGYRALRYYAGTVSPTVGRPWKTTP